MCGCTFDSINMLSVHHYFTDTTSNTINFCFRFDVEDVVGTVVDRNRAICVQPFVMAEGYVLFDVAIGDGAYNWKGKYFIGTFKCVVKLLPI